MRGEYVVTAGQDKSVAELLIMKPLQNLWNTLKTRQSLSLTMPSSPASSQRESKCKWYRNGREIKEKAKSM